MALFYSILAIAFFIVAVFFLWLFFRSRGAFRVAFLFVALLNCFTFLLYAHILVIPFLSIR